MFCDPKSPLFTQERTPQNRICSDFFNTLSHKPALARLREVKHLSPITLPGKLVKIGVKVASHGQYVTFQLAEVAVPRELLRKLPNPIDNLRQWEYNFCGSKMVVLAP